MTEDVTDKRMHADRYGGMRSRERTTTSRTRPGRTRTADYNEVAYELLMIGWFSWLGIAMLRSAGHSSSVSSLPSPDRAAVLFRAVG